MFLKIHIEIISDKQLKIIQFSQVYFVNILRFVLVKPEYKSKTHLIMLIKSISSSATCQVNILYFPEIVIFI